MSTFHHTGDLGDICYALPSIRALGGGTLLFSSVPETREQMTEARTAFIRPLIMAQDYIKDVRIRKGEAVKYDFARFRDGFVRHLGLAEMQRRQVMPQKRVDFSIPWLKVDAEKHGYSVFHRSARYQNHVWTTDIWPQLLGRYPDAIFIGTKQEHTDFEKAFGKVTFKPVNNALEMAQIIAGSSLYVGNQSFPYSIAEGLKVNSILEVWPECMNCHFPRENGKHIARIEDWSPHAKETKIAIALQWHPGEKEAVNELLCLIRDIEQVKRDNVELWLFPRDDVRFSDEWTRMFEGMMRQCFADVRVIQSKRRGRGWPEGCNDLWQSCMILAARLHMDKKTDVEAVFTFEPDIVPLRSDWIDRLIIDWKAAKAENKLASGYIAGAPGREHMNGNGIFSTDIVKRYSELQACAGPWDAYHRRLLMKIGRHSDSMVNLYQKATIDRGEIELIRKAPPRHTLLHGVKDGSARAIMRELLNEGKL